MAKCPGNHGDKFPSNQVVVSYCASMTIISPALIVLAKCILDTAPSGGEKLLHRVQNFLVMISPLRMIKVAIVKFTLVNSAVKLLLL